MSSISKAVPGAAIPGAAVPGNNTPASTAGVGSATLTGAGTVTAAGSSTTHGATLTGAGTLTATGVLRGSATLTGAGALTAIGSASSAPPAVVNQWAATFAQPAAFGPTPPALQSSVIALTPASSVGGGSGTPTAGNWLFCVSGWSQKNQATAATHAAADDIHSFWRAGNVTTSIYAVSAAAGKSRANVWYAPNLARAPGDVYVAPSGAVNGRACLVIEVSGLGTWDTVTGITANYAGAATSLPLSLGAPSGQAFVLGAVCGDLTGAGQAFAPGGWTALSTVTAQNGTDHVADAVLTSAYIVTSGSLSVSGTASSATDLSGVLIGVLTSAPSPIPASQNPAWPYMKFEAALGSGFQSAPDQMQWTDLTNRCWAWDEQSGIQFELGSIQATNLITELDSFDGALNPHGTPWSFSVSGTPAASNYFIVFNAQAASISVGDGFTDTRNPGTLFTVTNIAPPFAGFNNITFTPAASAVMSSPDTVTRASLAAGTPVRLRAALGTLGGLTSNRWYVIQRNAHEWQQHVSAQDLRTWTPLTGTDIWTAMSAYGSSPYRGEVLQDSPYAWWPCDDQPSSGGVQPVSLRNAAPGNSNALNIVLSPNGATAQLVYSTARAAPVTNNTAAPVPLIAQYTAGQPAGWMYGDPQSSPAATATSGGEVTAQPGSSAWTQLGVAGNTGSNAFFLSCNDNNFPVLSSGITVEGWFNFAFFGTSTGQTSSIYGGSGGNQSGQPVTALTIVELATASAAVCVLQLDSSGHLNLITYNGNTPTSNSIYSTADLRSNSWHHFAITLTTTTWAVYVDGGQTATVSGSGVSMTSAWTYLLAAGDTGTAGGTGTASIAHSGNVSLAHLAVYPAILPAYRIIAHYWAAATAFGLLPAPQGVTATMTGNPSGGQGNTWAVDGSVFQGTYTGTLTNATSNITAIVTANAGSFTSGPSTWAPAAAIGERIFAWVGWTTGLAPAFQIFTASSHGSETEASTTVGAGDSYTAGYGGSATGTGNCHSAGGTGASPPTAATATGDVPGQRMERVIGYAGVAGLGYGGVISPCRCIDQGTLALQAATDVGGVQCSQNLSNVAQSDGGWLFVDNLGFLTYWQKTHLASQYSGPAWTFSPNAPPSPGASISTLPYDRNISISADPQRLWNSIAITPFSPDGVSLPLVIPASTATAVASQVQGGAQPLQITSYLQSTAEMGNQANWLLSNYGTPQLRIEHLEIDAASTPAAWQFVMGANVGDVISVQSWAIGNTGTTGTYRISSLHRDIRFAGQNQEVVATISIAADFEPTSYWS